MKTADLINVLARDVRPVRRVDAVQTGLLVAIAGGSLSLVIMLAWLGLRPMEAAVHSVSFWMKAAFTASVSVAALALVGRWARPGGVGRPAVLAIVAIFAVMGLLGAGQWFMAPPDQRLALWLGQTWTVCSIKIVVLALPVLAGALWSMRRMAPTNAAAAGAAAGLLAGAVGATIYGLHCPETAATFVATWYSLGMLACCAAGGVAGRYLLRW